MGKFGVLLLAAMASFPVAAAPICPAGVTDDTLQNLPAPLVGRAKELFGLSMPDDLVQRTTVMRCANGSVLLCNAGANLPCGKANTSQNLPGVIDWCRENPQASVVPAFAAGHDTIYTWRCDGGVPRAGGPVQPVDARGFFTRFWQKAQ